MTSRTRKLVTQIGSFVLAGVLLYLALRDVDFAAVGQALREADYRWLVPLVVIALISHGLRSWRWKVLLEALPYDPAQAAPRRVSFKTSFYSVMIGYMVNYAAPRLGEAARSANMAAREKLSFSGVLGTVVVERILDTLLLGLALVSVLFLLADRLPIIETLFFAPFQRWIDSLSLLLVVGIIGAVTVLVFLIYRGLLRYGDTALRSLWTERLRPILASFKDGMATLLRARRRPTLVFTTLGMWFCYTLMAYIPFLILGMTDTYDLSLLDSWSIMNIGAIGVVIPSPGGTGSYHYITIQTLVYLFDVDHSPSATYAVLTHAAQLVLYVLAGFICLVLQGSNLKTLRKRTRKASQHQPAPSSSSSADIHHDKS